MQVLLINPPIYDFTAYDYWLRPYGMLRVAGRIQHACSLTFFNFLLSRQRDAWGRGRFHEQVIPKPAAFGDIPRFFRRFGRPRDEFRDLLRQRRFDVALIQTTMTYWYPGVQEVIEDLRELAPRAKIVLGGIYASLCPDHALSLGAHLVVEKDNLKPLWNLLGTPRSAPPYRDVSMGTVAAMKLTEGCPFRCTYCSVPLLQPQFATRPVEECLQEARRLAASGVQNVAFYDDSLLFRPEQVLVPFLEGVIREHLPLSFHTPNALNVRFLTPELASLMVQAGFRSFFLGFESVFPEWLRKTGDKSSAEEFAAAVAALRQAGAESAVAYVIIGHPDAGEEAIESSMRFAHEHGARVYLSEFAPIPGTIDGQRCGAWADMNEPLAHNKTAFTIRRMGADRLNRFKSLCRTLNSSLSANR